MRSAGDERQAQAAKSSRGGCARLIGTDVESMFEAVKTSPPDPVANATMSNATNAREQL
jgi:hypothetical protein